MWINNGKKKKKENRKKGEFSKIGNKKKLLT